MSIHPMKRLSTFVALPVAFAFGWVVRQTDLLAPPSASAAEAEGTVSPVEPREREAYYPNSEALAADEMRVVACGTGMPTTRAAQAAA